MMWFVLKFLTTGWNPMMWFVLKFLTTGMWNPAAKELLLLLLPSLPLPASPTALIGLVSSSILVLSPSPLPPPPVPSFSVPASSIGETLGFAVGIGIASDRDPVIGKGIGIGTTLGRLASSTRSYNQVITVFTGTGKRYSI